MYVDCDIIGLCSMVLIVLSNYVKCVCFGCKFVYNCVIRFYCFGCNDVVVEVEYDFGDVFIGVVGICIDIEGGCG